MARTTCGGNSLGYGSLWYDSRLRMIGEFAMLFAVGIEVVFQRQDISNSVF